jgi:hypothetical protein
MNFRWTGSFKHLKTSQFNSSGSGTREDGGNGKSIVDIVEVSSC